MAYPRLLSTARAIARMGLFAARPITLQMCRERVQGRRVSGQSVIWRQADIPQVDRRAPVLTPGGKLLPFYTQAPSRDGGR